MKSGGGPYKVSMANMPLEVDLTGQRGFPEAKMGESEKKTIWERTIRPRPEKTSLGLSFCTVGNQNRELGDRTCWFTTLGVTRGKFEVGPPIWRVGRDRRKRPVQISRWQG